MAQAGVVICGLGYNPSTKTCTISGEKTIEHKFDKIENVVIRKIEFDTNPKVRIQYWNRTVHLWLKYTIFLRVLNVERYKNNKQMASLITFMVSAFWHGFYPIYYLFFFLFYILEQTCTMLEEDFNLFNKINSQNIIVRGLFIIFTQFFCNYLGIIFSFITFHNALIFSWNIIFIPPVLLVSLYVMLNNYRRKIKVLKRRKDREIEMIKTTPTPQDETSPLKLE
jgi:lysophospholipid acyltransferase